MSDPSHHLLRTLASIPLQSRILDLECGAGRRAEALVALGFDVYACDARDTAVVEARGRLAGQLGADDAERRVTPARPEALGYPDAFFDWVVAFEPFREVHTEETLLDCLRETLRVLKDGGWVYLALPAVEEEALLDDAAGYAGDSGLDLTFTAETLGRVMAAAGFEEAERPRRLDEGDRPLLHAIYRRVSEHTPR